MAQCHQTHRVELLTPHKITRYDYKIQLSHYLQVLDVVKHNNTFHFHLTPLPRHIHKKVMRPSYFLTLLLNMLFSPPPPHKFPQLHLQCVQHPLRITHWCVHSFYNTLELLIVSELQSLSHSIVFCVWLRLSVTKWRVIGVHQWHIYVDVSAN